MRWALRIAMSIAIGAVAWLVVTLVEPVNAVASAFGLSPPILGIAATALALARFFLLARFN